MSHTPQSQSLSLPTSLPDRQIQSAPGPQSESESQPQPQSLNLSTAARRQLPPVLVLVELLFWFRVCWGMIDDKSRKVYVYTSVLLVCVCVCVLQVLGHLSVRRSMFPNLNFPTTPELTYSTYSLKQNILPKKIYVDL